MSAENLIKELYGIADPKIAEHSKRFFKTGAGEYGEGDQFLGIRVPAQRKIATKFHHLSFREIKALLKSTLHEVRLTALFILVRKYEKAGDETQKEIFQFYISNLDRVNNWDLVDSSAAYIAGRYLFDKDRSLLFELAASDNLWKRRVAIIATHYFIRKGDSADTFKISEILLNDEHDLIHKACGWMLRETGKKDMDRLEKFLTQHYQNIPRTMLRYAIEKMPDSKRKLFLKGSFQSTTANPVNSPSK